MSAGFPKEGLAFFRELAQHNDRDWFEAHRAVWDEQIAPAMIALGSDLQARLRDALPGLQYVPRAGGSLYRLNRDTRFSKDKSPYHTHAALILWEGIDRHGSPAVYLEISPERVLFAGGVWIFEEEGALDRYRKRVLNHEAGERLQKALAAAKRAGLLPDAQEKLPKAPRGVDPEHPRAELMKLKGLAVTRAQKPGAWVSTDELLERLEAAARAYVPLHQWLRAELFG